MTEPHYRVATVDDLDDIFRIRAAVTENMLSDPNKVTHDDAVRAITEDGRGWVAVVDGRTVGFSVGRTSEADIWALFMDAGFEGRGIGRQLLSLATDWLFAQGLDELWLYTAADTRADRLYRAAGWCRGEIDAKGDVRYTLSRQQLKARLPVE